MSQDPNPYSITLDNGVYVNMAYIRRRISSACHFPHNYRPGKNRKAIIDFLMSPAWLSPRRGYTMSALCKDAAFDDVWFEGLEF